MRKLFEDIEVPRKEEGYDYSNIRSVREFLDLPWHQPFIASVSAKTGLTMNQVKDFIETQIPTFSIGKYLAPVGEKRVASVLGLSTIRESGRPLFEESARNLIGIIRSKIGEPYKSGLSNQPAVPYNVFAQASPAFKALHSAANAVEAPDVNDLNKKKLPASKFILGSVMLNVDDVMMHTPGYEPLGEGLYRVGASGIKVVKRVGQHLATGYQAFAQNAPLHNRPTTAAGDEIPASAVHGIAFLSKGVLPPGQGYWNAGLTGPMVMPNYVKTIQMPRDISLDTDVSSIVGKRFEGGVKNEIEILPGVKIGILGADWINVTGASMAFDIDTGNRNLIIQGQLGYEHNVAGKAFGGHKVSYANVGAGIKKMFPGAGPNVGIITEFNDPMEAAAGIYNALPEEELFEFAEKYMGGKIPDKWEPGMAEKVWEYSREKGRIKSGAFNQRMYIGEYTGSGEFDINKAIGNTNVLSGEVFGALEKAGVKVNPVARKMHEAGGFISNFEVENGMVFANVRSKAAYYEGPISVAARPEWHYSSQSVGPEQMEYMRSYEGGRYAARLASTLASRNQLDAAEMVKAAAGIRDDSAIDIRRIAREYPDIEAMAMKVAEEKDKGTFLWEHSRNAVIEKRMLEVIADKYRGRQIVARDTVIPPADVLLRSSIFGSGIIGGAGAGFIRAIKALSSPLGGEEVDKEYESALASIRETVAESGSSPETQKRIVSGSLPSIGGQVVALHSMPPGEAYIPKEPLTEFVRRSIEAGALGKNIALKHEQPEDVAEAILRGEAGDVLTQLMRFPISFPGQIKQSITRILTREEAAQRTGFSPEELDKFNSPLVSSLVGVINSGDFDVDPYTMMLLRNNKDLLYRGLTTSRKGVRLQALRATEDDFGGELAGWMEDIEQGKEDYWNLMSGSGSPGFLSKMAVMSVDELSEVSEEYYRKGLPMGSAYNPFIRSFNKIAVGMGISQSRAGDMIKALGGRMYMFAQDVEKMPNSMRRLMELAKYRYSKRGGGAYFDPIKKQWVGRSLYSLAIENLVGTANELRGMGEKIRGSDWASLLLGMPQKGGALEEPYNRLVEEFEKDETSVGTVAGILNEAGLAIRKKGQTASRAITEVSPLIKTLSSLAFDYNSVSMTKIGGLLRTYSNMMSKFKRIDATDAASTLRDLSNMGYVQYTRGVEKIATSREREYPLAIRQEPIQITPPQSPAPSVSARSGAPITTPPPARRQPSTPPPPPSRSAMPEDYYEGGGSVPPQSPPPQGPPAPPQSPPPDDDGSGDNGRITPPHERPEESTPASRLSEARNLINMFDPESVQGYRSVSYVIKQEGMPVSEFSKQESTDLPYRHFSRAIDYSKRINENLEAYAGIARKALAGEYPGPGEVEAARTLNQFARHTSQVVKEREQMIAAGAARRSRAVELARSVINDKSSTPAEVRRARALIKEADDTFESMVKGLLEKTSAIDETAYNLGLDPTSRASIGEGHDKLWLFAERAGEVKKTSRAEDRLANVTEELAKVREEAVALTKSGNKNAAELLEAYATRRAGSAISKAIGRAATTGDFSEIRSDDFANLINVASGGGGDGGNRFLKGLSTVRSFFSPFSPERAILRWIGQGILGNVATSQAAQGLAEYDTSFLQSAMTNTMGAPGVSRYLDWQRQKASALLAGTRAYQNTWGMPPILAREMKEAQGIFGPPVAASAVTGVGMALLGAKIGSAALMSAALPVAAGIAVAGIPLAGGIYGLRTSAPTPENYATAIEQYDSAQGGNLWHKLLTSFRGVGARTRELSYNERYDNFESWRPGYYERQGIQFAERAERELFGRPITELSANELAARHRVTAERLRKNFSDEFSVYQDTDLAQAMAFAESELGDVDLTSAKARGLMSGFLRGAFNINPRSITKAVTTGIPYHGVSLAGKDRFRMLDQMGAPIGTTGGLNYLSREWSTQLFNAIGSSANIPDLVSSPALSKGDLVGAFGGTGTAVDVWGGESMMELQYLNMMGAHTINRIQRDEQALQFQQKYGIQLRNIGMADIISGSYTRPVVDINQIGGTFGAMRSLDLQKQQLQWATSLGGEFNGYNYTGSIEFARQSIGAQAAAFYARFNVAGEQLALNRQYQLTTRGWNYSDMLTSMERGRIGFDWQMADAARQHERSVTRIGWSIEDLYRRRASESNADVYSNWQIGWQERMTAMRREWTQQDWAYNRQVRNLQWGWRMEDYEEDIRFSTGRARERLLRQRERDVTMYNIENNRESQQEERQKELWKMEDERWQKQKDRMQQERDERDKAWEIQLKRLQKQRQWADEDFATAAGRISQKRQWAEEDWQKQLERFKETSKYQDEQYALQLKARDAEKKAFEANMGIRMKQLEDEKAALEENKRISDEVNKIRSEIDENAIEAAQQQTELAIAMGENADVFETISRIVSDMRNLQNAGVFDALERIFGNMYANPPTTYSR